MRPGRADSVASSRATISPKALRRPRSSSTGPMLPDGPPAAQVRRGYHRLMATVGHHRPPQRGQDHPLQRPHRAAGAHRPAPLLHGGAGGGGGPGARPRAGAAWRRWSIPTRRSMPPWTCSICRPWPGPAPPAWAAASWGGCGRWRPSPWCCGPSRTKGCRPTSRAPTRWSRPRCCSSNWRWPTTTCSPARRDKAVKEAAADPSKKGAAAAVAAALEVLERGAGAAQPALERAGGRCLPRPGPAHPEAGGLGGQRRRGRPAGRGCGGGGGRRGAAGRHGGGAVGAHRGGGGPPRSRGAGGDAGGVRPRRRAPWPGWCGPPTTLCTC